MRIGLVEDDPYDQESLAGVVRACRAASHSLHDSPSDEGQPDSISCFSDGGEFFASWHPGDFDVLLLDCYLSGTETGVDVARRVRLAGDDVPIIFVTSSVDFAVEGYDVGAVGYVIKPPQVDAVAAALGRAVARRAAAGAAGGGALAGAGAAGAGAAGAGAGALVGAAGAGAAAASVLALGAAAAEHVVEVRGVGGQPVTLDLRALRWCTTSGHYLDLALERADGSLHVMRVRMRFKDLLAATRDIPSLYSCTRGCLVDLTFAVRLEGCDFVLRDGTRMPISRQNLARARDAFAAQAFSRMREDVGGMGAQLAQALRPAWPMRPMRVLQKLRLARMSQSLRPMRAPQPPPTPQATLSQRSMWAAGLMPAEVVVAILEQAIILPAALLCLVAVRRWFAPPLAYRALFFVALAGYSVVAGALCATFQLATNTLGIPLYAALLTLLMVVVPLSPGRLLLVYWTVVFVCSAISCASIGIDVFIMGPEVSTVRLSPAGAAVVWAMWGAALLVLWRPMTRYLPNMLASTVPVSFWRFAWMPACLASVLLVVCMPVDATTLLVNRVGVLSLLVLAMACAFMGLLYFLLGRLLRDADLAQKAARENRQLALRIMQVDHLEERIMQARRARHDLRQHDRVIRSLAVAGDTEGIVSYLDELAGLDASDARLTYCANPTVNPIVVYYADLARDLGANPDIELSLPSELAIPSVDLAVVFGNLLENAVNALEAQEQGERILRVRARVEDGASAPLFLTVDNSYDGEVRQLPSGAFASARHAGEGLGIESVRAVAERCGGATSFSFGEGMFQASVMLAQGAEAEVAEPWGANVGERA